MKYVYVLSYVKDIDPYERPLAVINSQRLVAKWLNIPKTNVQRAFYPDCTYATFGSIQVEKVLID